jgi:hypothetical protein
MKPLYVVLVEQHLPGAGQKGQAAELRICMSVELGGQSMLHMPRVPSGTMGSLGKSAGAPSRRSISVLVAKTMSLTR